MNEFDPKQNLPPFGLVKPDIRNINYFGRLSQKYIDPPVDIPDTQQDALQDTPQAPPQVNIEDKKSLDKAAKQKDDLSKTAQDMFDSGYLSKKLNTFAEQEALRQQFENNSNDSSYARAAQLGIFKNPAVVNYLAQTLAIQRQERSDRLNQIKLEIAAEKEARGLFHTEKKEKEKTVQGYLDDLYKVRNSLEPKKISRSKAMKLIEDKIKNGMSFAMALSTAEDELGEELLPNKDKWQNLFVLPPGAKTPIAVQMSTTSPIGRHVTWEDSQEPIENKLKLSPKERRSGDGKKNPNVPHGIQERIK